MYININPPDRKKADIDDYKDILVVLMLQKYNSSVADKTGIFPAPWKSRG